MARLFLVVSIALLFGMAFAGCVNTPAISEKEAEARRISAGGGIAAPAVYPGDYKFDGRYSQVLVEGIFKSLPPVRQYLESELDGAAVEIGYWLPDVPEGTKVPVIVDASPYHRVSSNVITLGGMKMFLHDNFLPHGYAVAAVSVRGSGNSGGCFDLMGPAETADLDQAITWLGEQPWSNGNVAMIGVSYDGSTPWNVASTGNKHLKTIVPISGLPDIFNLMYRNGSAESRGAFLVNAAYYTYGPSAEDATGQNASQQRGTEQRVQGTACPDYAAGLAGAGWAAIIGDRDPADYWADRDRRPAVEQNYRGSILHVQGLQDWNVDPALTIPWTSHLNLTNDIPVKWMLGQWGHASPDNRGPDQSPRMWTRYDWSEVLLHWFDKYLKDLPVDTGPNAQVQDNAGRWHNADHFPPRDATWTTFHLGTGGQLLTEPGAAGSTQLVPNPQGQAGCDQFRSFACQSVEFGMQVGEEGLHFSGLPRLHVTVNPQGPGGNVAAFLYNINATGQYPVGWTTMNLMYADGSETRRAVMPGQDLLLKMEFQPLDDYIEPGARLVVRLWEFQDHDRIPNVPPSPVTIKWGGSATSTLELPVIDLPPEAFFEVPMPPKDWKPATTPAPAPLE